MSYTKSLTATMGIQYYIHIIEQLANYMIIAFICITNNNTSVM